MIPVNIDSYYPRKLLPEVFLVCGQCFFKEAFSWPLEKSLDDPEIIAKFKKKGWSIKPTLCSKCIKHNREYGIFEDNAIF